MNNFPLPFFQANNNIDILNEINKIKEEIKKINIKLEKLENNKSQVYLKKDDGYYII